MQVAAAASCTPLPSSCLVPVPNYLFVVGVDFFFKGGMGMSAHCLCTLLAQLTATMA